MHEFLMGPGKSSFMQMNNSATDELVQEFYGLDLVTMLIDSVSITKKRTDASLDVGAWIHSWTADCRKKHAG